jgi:hypothetical protein
MWRSILIKTITAFVIVLFLVLPCDGEEKNSPLPEFEKPSTKQDRYSCLSKIKDFGLIRVVFHGENEKKIGLNNIELSNFLRLKYKNNFAGFPYNSIFNRKDAFNEMIKKKIGMIIVTIWAVGDNYPIAYHVELKAKCLGSDALDTYEDAYLGYSYKAKIKGSIRKSIEDLVEKFAIIFFKARGEL